MKTHDHTERRSRPAKTIRVTGVLDLREARRLVSSLRNTPEDVGLYVDVSSVREAHDAAVVALAQAVTRRNGVIVGLSRHHATLLGYVGQITAHRAP
jgi:hypothetical protein